MEPDFISQTAEARTPEQRMEWLRKRTADANAKGATFHRAIVSDDHANLLLLESWKVAPKDQGEPRWQMQTRENDNATNS
jgi:hypothetical protein